MARSILNQTRKITKNTKRLIFNNTIVFIHYWGIELKSYKHQYGIRQSLVCISFGHQLMS